MVPDSHHILRSSFHQYLLWLCGSMAMFRLKHLWSFSAVALRRCSRRHLSPPQVFRTELAALASWFWVGGGSLYCRPCKCRGSAARFIWAYSIRSKTHVKVKAPAKFSLAFLVQQSRSSDSSQDGSVEPSSLKRQVPSAPSAVLWINAHVQVRIPAELSGHGPE